MNPKALFLTLTLAALALAPTAARAVDLNLPCDQAAAVIVAGSDADKGVVIGELIGAAASIADLICFAGDPRCGCLRAVTDSDTEQGHDFPSRAGGVLGRCRFADPNRQLSGIAWEAALNTCPR